MTEHQPKSQKRSRSLALGVEEAITRQIAEGKLAEGEKLPTEAQLMVVHGVSRTVIRETISRLQAAGFVETRHGIGTFVLNSTPSSSRQLDPASIDTITDIIAMLELRISLETEAAALAAIRRSEEDLQKMRASLDAFEEQALRGDDAVLADVQFHMLIAKATGNSYFEDVYRYIGQGAIPRNRINTAQFAEEGQSAFLARTNSEHRDIFLAIQDRDVETAKAAMRLHLANSRARLNRVAAEASSPSLRDLKLLS